jgi:putative tryptophan/tyrosine transport system substrate-binding protein
MRWREIIALLDGGSPQGYAPMVAAFGHGLKEEGYIVGRGVAIEFRWAEGQFH